MHKVHFTEMGSKAEQLLPELPMALDQDHVNHTLGTMTRQCIVDLAILFEQWKHIGQEITTIPITLLGKIIERWMPSPHASIRFLMHCPILMERRVCAIAGDTTPYLTLKQVIKDHMISLLKEEWMACATHALEERTRGEVEINNLSMLSPA